jgi:hypothetical protein
MGSTLTKVNKQPNKLAFTLQEDEPVVCCMAGEGVLEVADQLHGGMQTLLSQELQTWSFQINFYIPHNHFSTICKSLVSRRQLGYI